MTDAFALDVTRLYDEWSLHDAALFAGTEAVLRSTSTYHGPGVETVRAALDNAAAVAERIEALLDAGVAPPDVGFIAAYSGQVREIRSRLGTLDREATGLTVDTVDSFQGGERDAIVVSFARSNPDANAGFLEHPAEGPRRLNVALTRARKHLALVGDWDTLATRATHRTPEESCADTYATLRDTLAGLDDVELVEYWVLCDTHGGRSSRCRSKIEVQGRESNRSETCSRCCARLAEFDSCLVDVTATERVTTRKAVARGSGG
jgi:hypothetical protein